MQAIAFRRVHGRIELDQHVAGLDRLPVLHTDGPHHTGLERLDDLGAAARHDFSGRRCDDIDRAPPGPDQRRAEQQDDGGRSYGQSATVVFHDFKRGRQERQLFAALPCARRNELTRRIVNLPMARLADLMDSCLQPMQ